MLLCSQLAGRLLEKQPSRSPGRGGLLSFRALLLRPLLSFLQLGLGLWVLVGTFPSQAEEAPPARALIVKYRAEGAHALEACAERISSSPGLTFSGASRDDSDSLDRIGERFGLGRQRAVFRQPAPETLAQRRRRLRAAWANRRTSQQTAHRTAGESGADHGSSGNPSRSRAVSPGDPNDPDLAHVYRVAVPPGVSAETLRKAFESDAHVAYVQYDHPIDVDQLAVFDDPYLASSGSWGQDHPDLWGPGRIGADHVWPRTQGEGVVVAVVDTGVDLDHPEIAGNLWVNPGEDLDGDGRATEADRNGIDDDGNGFIDDLNGFDFANSDEEAGLSDADPFDDNGHGTHIAGTIAAIAGNGEGIVGIAPRSRIMALKGFPATGSASDAVLWRAVLYAAENGARVVNNSWSCSVPCPENPLAEEVLGLVDELGLVVVTSAGNSGADVVFQSPENRDGVITVGALGVDDEVPGFSNRGWLVDVVAPGGGPNGVGTALVPRRNILSLLSSGAEENQLPFRVGPDSGPGYLRLSGTSMAAPHVVGAIALLLSERPELSPFEVRQLLRLSSEDLGSPGHDPVFGAGLLAADRLLDEPLPDLRFRLLARQGITHDPADGDYLIRGEAEGESLASLSVAVGRGLTPTDFVPLDVDGAARSPGDGFSEPVEEGAAPILARWPVADVPDGPYVLRVRAELRDGRRLEEHTVVGIERNAPMTIARDSERELGGPAISGRRVVFQIDESSRAIHDVAVAEFPRRRAGRGASENVLQEDPQRIVELDDDQRDLRLSGRELLFITRGEDGRSLSRCRLHRGSPACEAEPIVDAPGVFGENFVGQAGARLQVVGKRAVWTRRHEGETFIEGCVVGRKQAECSPERLVPAAALGERDWRLLSSDGARLLLVRGSDLAFCDMNGDPGGSAECEPRAISRPAEAGLVSSARHAGDLVAFVLDRLSPVVTEGCEIFDPRPGCATTFELVSELKACWISDVGHCEPVALGPAVPAAHLKGIAVSGRRIAWSAAATHELAAVSFCEFQPATGTCPAQRIGGAPAEQSRPAMAGARLVWEDTRLGPGTIQGLELPRLIARSEIRLRPGQRFAFPLRGIPGSTGGLKLSVSFLDGSLEPSQARARLRLASRPRRRSAEKHQEKRPNAPVPAQLVGRVPRWASGTTRWVLRAEEAGGLYTERIVEIEIRPPASPWRWDRLGRWARSGSPFWTF